MFIEHLDFIPIAELGDSRSLSQPVDCYFLPSLFNPCASANIPIRLYVELWLWSMQHSCLQAHLLFCMLRCVACGLLSKFVGRLSAGFFPRSVFHHLQSQPYFNQSQRVPTLHILLSSLSKETSYIAVLCICFFVFVDHPGRGFTIARSRITEDVTCPVFAHNKYLKLQNDPAKFCQASSCRD